MSTAKIRIRNRNAVDPADESSYGPRRGQVAPADAVEVAFTADEITDRGALQAAINSHAAGTTYWVRAGVRRMIAAVTPKTGDTIVGEYGAVFNGSKLLTDWVQDGAAWYVTGQAQNSLSGYLGTNCQVGYPRCFWTNDVFFDNVPMVCVAALGDVVPGAFFFDYDADRIYIGTDPTGHTVETTVAATGITHGSSNNVTLRNLTLEKYGNAAQQGVIAGHTDMNSATPTGWTAEYCEVRLSHGLGIRVGSGGHVYNNYVHHMGQMGIGGGGNSAAANILTNIEAVNNELAFCNYAKYAVGWEAGGCKFAVTDGLLLRGNYSHDHDGFGLWVDTNNRNVVVEQNLVEDCTASGILYEISFGPGLIQNNIVRRCSVPRVATWLFGAGILNQNSRDVECCYNTVEECGGGISLIMQPSRATPGEGTNPPALYGETAFTVDNWYAHDNTVTMTMGLNGLGQDGGDNTWFTDHNVRWDYNVYNLQSAPASPFAWMNGSRTEAQWQAYGLDTHGTFNR